jgi:hypothetical protein
MTRFESEIKKEELEREDIEKTRRLMESPTPKAISKAFFEKGRIAADEALVDEAQELSLGLQEQLNEEARLKDLEKEKKRLLN